MSKPPNRQPPARPGATRANAGRSPQGAGRSRQGKPGLGSSPPMSRRGDGAGPSRRDDDDKPRHQRAPRHERHERDDDRAPHRGKPQGRPNRNIPAEPAAPASRPMEPMRIAKALARSGLCSRREAERWIEMGRVSVNGDILKSPARDVGPKDRIVVDGKPLPEAEPARLWRYHKPRGLVTTHKDPEGRPTVFDKLPKSLPRVISIGRLDYNTEGLLLLTNDGELARHLELPATGWLRRYRVRAHGRVTQAQLDAFKDGIEIEGVRYGPIDATLDKEQGANVWLTIGLREGKNREVRKILGTLALDVNRLIRISFGPFQLLDLGEGEVEHVARRVLADQLGPLLAEAMNLVDAPVVAERKPLRSPVGSPARTPQRPAKPRHKA